MKYVYGCLIGGFLCLLTPQLTHAEDSVDKSCECPKLACDPCSYQESIKFFTEKCGAKESKVKSCARPRCIPIETATKECPVPPQANSGPREPVVVKGDVPKINESDIQKNVPAAGRVKVIQGSVSIVHADGKKSVVNQDTEIREGETIESGADGAAVVNFEGGNKLHVHPDTAVEVKEFKEPGVDASRKALLNLIKGKVRNQVNQKYDGKSSYYKIQTRAAVAGVRGTDFVVEERMDGSKLESKIDTLGGKVILASLDEAQTREIMRGERAQFTVELPDPSFKDKDISAFIKRGTMSPVHKIPADELKELDKNSDVNRLAKAKKPKNTNVAICEKPKGQFNQCAWKCTAAGAGGKCQTCTRQRCNGNGEWAEETNIAPGKSSVTCPSTGFLVKDCDY